MYSTCLFCTRDLGANEVIERFPVGRRLAFDAQRGRLWVVCRHCERWNLTPLEERWEAVEECERRFRTARKRAATDQIGFAKLNEGLELVRIGEPLRPEFAAWRYGDQFGRRRRRTVTRAVGIGAAATAAVAGALTLGVAALGAPWLWQAGDAYLQRRRDRRMIALVPSSEGEWLTVRGEHVPQLRVTTDIGGELGWKLVVTHAEGTHSLQGRHALHAASLILPTINGTGGTRPKVERAIRRLETFPDPIAFMRSTAAISSHAKPGHAGSVAGLPVDLRLAIEMAANEENERCALEGEMALLEMAWEEAEEIAAIADSLTTPTEVERQLDALRRKLPSPN